MKCTRCRRTAQTNLKTLGSFCNRCFLEVIEKRVRKDLRLNKWIEKNDNILIINDGSKESRVGECLLKNIIKDLPVRIRKLKKINKEESKKYNKIIVPWNLDKEVEAHLSRIFTKALKKQQPKKEVKLLRNILDKEIEIFAKLKGFRYSKKPRTQLQRMMDKLEEKYPGCKFSVLNSMKFVNS